MACLHETFCGLKSYDPTLNSFVIPVSFQMFADCHCFLYQIIQILWQIWSQTHCFHYPEDFVPRHKSHLCNSMGITKNDTFKIKDNALSSSIQPLTASQVQHIYTSMHSCSMLLGKECKNFHVNECQHILIKCNAVTFHTSAELFQVVTNTGQNST